MVADYAFLRCKLFARFFYFFLTGEHPVPVPDYLTVSYNPTFMDAGCKCVSSGNISDFMEEFQRLGRDKHHRIGNMNCKVFPKSPLGEEMAELLAKYQGDKSPALIVLIGQGSLGCLSSLPDSICGNTPVVVSLSSRNAILLPGDTVDLKTWMPESVDFFTDFPVRLSRLASFMSMMWRPTSI